MLRQMKPRRGLPRTRGSNTLGWNGIKAWPVRVMLASWLALKVRQFLDDDDLRLPGTLDLQTAVLETTDAGFVCGAMLIADQDYNLTGGFRAGS